MSPLAAALIVAGYAGGAVAYGWHCYFRAVIPILGELTAEQQEEYAPLLTGISAVFALAWFVLAPIDIWGWARDRRAAGKEEINPDEENKEN